MEIEAYVFRGRRRGEEGGGMRFIDVNLDWGWGDVVVVRMGLVELARQT